MNDRTKPNADATLETNKMVLEAFEISTTESAGVVNDSNSLECVTKHFEQYIQSYQDSWQAVWENTVREYEENVKNWQNDVSLFLAHPQASADNQEPSAPKQGKSTKPAAKTQSKPTSDDKG